MPVSTLGPLELGLAALALGQADLARADLGVQVVLDRVDLVGPRPALGPEVLRVVRRAAELERDEVILLVVGRPAR